ncbi:hypothetical protein pb186bvf_001400 [Paramecium bursaria]
MLALYLYFKILELIAKQILIYYLTHMKQYPPCPDDLHNLKQICKLCVEKGCLKEPYCCEDCARINHEGHLTLTLDQAQKVLNKCPDFRDEFRSFREVVVELLHKMERDLDRQAKQVRLYKDAQDFNFEMLRNFAKLLKKIEGNYIQMFREQIKQLNKEIKDSLKKLLLKTENKKDRTRAFISKRIKQSYSKQVESLLELGNIWFTEEQYEKAIKFYEEALRFEPSNSELMHNKAFALEKLHQYPEAIKIYNQVLMIDPRNTDALKNKGNCLMELLDFEEALQQYDFVLSIEPQDIGALYNKGLAYQKLKQSQDAIEQFDQCIKMDPNYLDAINSKGDTLLNQSLYEEALLQFETSLQINKRDTLALCGKGIALSKLEKYDKAHAAFDRAIKLEPGSQDAIYNKGQLLYVLIQFLGLTYKRQKLYELACQQFEKILELYPGHHLAEEQLEKVKKRQNKLIEESIGLEENKQQFKLD